MFSLPLRVFMKRIRRALLGVAPSHLLCGQSPERKKSPRVSPAMPQPPPPGGGATGAQSSDLGHSPPTVSRSFCAVTSCTWARNSSRQRGDPEPRIAQDQALGTGSSATEPRGPGLLGRVQMSALQPSIRLHLLLTCAPATPRERGHHPARPTPSRCHCEGIKPKNHVPVGEFTLTLWPWRLSSPQEP